MVPGFQTAMEDIFCGELAQARVHQVLDILVKEPEITTVVAAATALISTLPRPTKW